MSTLVSNTQSSQSISYRRIGRIALPVLLANLAMPLQSAIDTAVVGHFPATADLAGMGLAVQLISLLLVSFNFLQYASSGLSAQALGQAASEQHAHPTLLAILQRAMLIAVVLAVVIFAARDWLVDVGLTLLSASPASRVAASEYLNMRFFSIAAELLNFAFLGWFAGQGQTRLMLYQQSFIAGVNIVLTLILVYGLHLGLTGVALGTALAFWSGIVLALWMSKRRLQCRFVELFVPAAKVFTAAKLTALFSLNKDIFVRTLVLTLSFAWLTRLAAMSGDTVLAANAILLQVLSISAFALDGVAVSAETLSGQTAGRGDVPAFLLAVKRTGVVSYALAFALTLVWWLVMPWYLHLMTDIKAVWQLAYAYRWYAIVLPVLGVGAYWLDGVFFGLTAGRVIRNAALVVAAVFFPLSGYLYQKLGMSGIWLGVCALLLLRLLVLGGWLWRHRRHPLFYLN